MKWYVDSNFYSMYAKGKKKRYIRNYHNVLAIVFKRLKGGGRVLSVCLLCFSLSYNHLRFFSHHRVAQLYTRAAWNLNFNNVE